MSLQTDQKSTLFETAFEQYATRHLTTFVRVGALEQAAAPALYNFLRADLHQNLLLYDRICFKVFGENIPLAMLINMLGIKNVELLVEQEALEFKLWTQQVLYMQDNIKGVIPIAPGNATDLVHTEPELSLRTSFKWLTRELPRQTREGLVKKLVRKYSIPEGTIANTSSNLTWSAYKSNKLEVLRLPFVGEDDLSIDLKKGLGAVADDILESSIVASGNYVSHNSYSLTKLVRRSVDDIRRKLSIRETIMELFRIENMPDIRAAVLSSKVGTDDLLKLRNSNGGARFRAWLSSVNQNDDLGRVTELYVSAAAEAKGIFETPVGNIAKTVFFCGLGTAVGYLFAGPLAAMIGAGLGKALEVGVDLGLDMFDSMILSNLSRGWSPKLYIDDLKRLSIKGRGSDSPEQ